MRLDRQITLKIAAPLLNLRKRQRPGIPILMYHSISQPKGNHRHPYFETCTSPEVFAQHMKYLHVNNYQVISLTEATRILQSLQLKTQNSKLKTIKPVVLTFDDGFRDFYTAAAPVLQQYAFTATVFLPTAYISDKGAAFKGIACLTWDKVRELRQAGFSFGSHTVTHPQLHSLSRQAIEQEIRASKDTIESQLAQSIDCFSYPYAFPQNDRLFANLIFQMLLANGYQVGVTTQLGVAEPQNTAFALKRIPINAHDDTKFFEGKLNSAYDWLAWPQHIYKIIMFEQEGSLQHEKGNHIQICHRYPGS